MKYSEIIKYEKTIKNIVMFACYIVIIIAVYLVGYYTKNIALCFITAILMGILFLPTEMKLERNIKEMEILLKLEKLIDRENNKPKQ